MSKWEQVYTQVLSSLVAGRGDDIEATWMNGGLDITASSLSTMAARIADRAIKDMRLLQPSESEL